MVSAKKKPRRLRLSGGPGAPSPPPRDDSSLSGKSDEIDEGEIAADEALAEEQAHLALLHALECDPTSAMLVAPPSSPGFFSWARLASARNPSMSAAVYEANQRCDDGSRSSSPLRADSASSASSSRSLARRYRPPATFFVVRPMEVDGRGRCLVGVESGPHPTIRDAVASLAIPRGARLPSTFILLTRDAVALRDDAAADSAGDGAPRFVITAADREAASKTHGEWEVDFETVEEERAASAQFDPSLARKLAEAIADAEALAATLGGVSRDAGGRVGGVTASPGRDARRENEERGRSGAASGGKQHPRDDPDERGRRRKTPREANRDEGGVRGGRAGDDARSGPAPARDPPAAAPPAKRGRGRPAKAKGPEAPVAASAEVSQRVPSLVATIPAEQPPERVTPPVPPHRPWTVHSVPFVAADILGGALAAHAPIPPSPEMYHTLRGQVLGGIDASRAIPSLPAPAATDAQFQLARPPKAPYHVLAVRCGRRFEPDDFAVRLNDRGYAYVRATNGGAGGFEFVSQFPTSVDERSAQSMYKDGVLFVVACPKDSDDSVAAVTAAYT